MKGIEAIANGTISLGSVNTLRVVVTQLNQLLAGIGQFPDVISHTPFCPQQS